MYCSNCGNKVSDDTNVGDSCGNQVLVVANNGTVTQEHGLQFRKIDERRILISYIVAICAPLVLGGYGNGIGHFVIGKYKRGISILLGTLVLMFTIAWFLVGWPLVGANYTLPWAEYDEWDGFVLVESLWPGVLITMLSGFLIWILQIVDLIRVNRALRTTQD